MANISDTTAELWRGIRVKRKPSQTLREWNDAEMAKIQQALDRARQDALEEAEWAAHGAIVTIGLAGPMPCPADIAVNVCDAIKVLKAKAP